MDADLDPKAAAAQLDARAQAALDESREAVAASRQTLEEARALLRRLEEDAAAPPAAAEPRSSGPVGNNP